MGRTAQSAWILRIFGVLLCALAPMHAQGTATAQGVALNGGAGCSAGHLDITLTTVGAHREFWMATTLTGATLVQGETGTGLSTYSGTYSPFQIGFLAAQPANTLIGSYAYVGETPPSAADTAEFFVYYNCTTQQVILSCFGARGTCPQTAQQAAAALASRVPTLGAWALVFTVLLVGAAGTLALRHRRA